MKRKLQNILIMVFILTAAAGPWRLSPAAAEKGKSAPKQATEYEVKAAFLYNFIKFTDWPKDKVSEPNLITIGLLGDHDFQNVFDAVKDKKINDNNIIVKEFGKFERFLTKDKSGNEQFTKEIEELGKCHLLFICDSEQKYYKEINSALNSQHVLTVGETEDFLNEGGIIAFIPGTEKAAFEINQTEAKRAEIKISSRVLRLARRVIGAETSE